MKQITQADLKVASKIKFKFKEERSTKQGIKLFESTKDSMDMLTWAQSTFDSFHKIRAASMRNKRYYRGEQWSDRVTINGVSMTEEEYITMQGKPAFKQNLIRPQIRNAIGQFRSSPYKSVVTARNRDNQLASEMMTIALESVHQMNDQKERDARMLEEFFNSSTAIYSTACPFNEERKRAIPIYRAVNINRFFCDVNTEDILSEDIKIIGEISDISLLDLVGTYAKNRAQETQLRNLYASVREDFVSTTAFDRRTVQSADFLLPNSSGLCRIIKIHIKQGEWKLLAHDYSDASYEYYPMSKLKDIEQENIRRQQLSIENGVQVPFIDVEERFIQTWHYYHMTPHGHILWHSETPYKHNSHPYVVKFYPLLDGEVWSMVEDLIDQQRMINRMMILQDFIISASAKGVLLVPEDAIPDDMTIEDFADEWTKYNGVIKIKTKAGVELPKQISANAMNIGINDFINTQIKLMQDIGGVHGAIQGKSPNANTPAALYAQETQNASLNILDIMETYASFLQKRDYKLIQLIKQFYTEKHYQALSGKSVSTDAKWYDPDLIANIDFENAITRGTDTPTYRMILDDMLWKLLEGRLIGIEMFLENSSYPFSDKLLQAIQRQKEQIQTGQMPETGVSPELAQQVSQEIPPSSQQGIDNVMKMMYGTKPKIVS